MYAENIGENTSSIPVLSKKREKGERRGRRDEAGREECEGREGRKMIMGWTGDSKRQR